MYLVGFALLNLQFLSSVLLTIICLFVLFILTILIICSSSIYGFWLPLWYLQIFFAIQFDENFCLYISKLLHWTKRCEPSDGILWYSKISLLLGYTCFVGQMIRRKWMLNILKWTAVCEKGSRWPITRQNVPIISTITLKTKTVIIFVLKRVYMVYTRICFHKILHVATTYSLILRCTLPPRLTQICICTVDLTEEFLVSHCGRSVAFSGYSGFLHQ